MQRRTLAAPARALALTLCVGACGQEDPEALELWQRVHDLAYQHFERAPGYATRQPSPVGAHGPLVDIYVNPVVGDALAGPHITRWPTGSLIVKDGFELDGSPHLVAVMEKRADGWYWAEYTPDGDVKYAGSPSLCTDCHADGGSDFTRAFALP